MSTATMSTAKTIAEQIRWGDNWRPARWAAREYVALPETKEYAGGLRFKVSGTKNVKRGGYVYVYLTWLDVYTVKVVKVYGMKITTVAEREMIYCDQLGEVIDNILDG